LKGEVIMKKVIITMSLLLLAAKAWAQQAGSPIKAATAPETFKQRSKP
jgi:hypothetical protein